MRKTVVSITAAASLILVGGIAFAQGPTGMPTDIPDGSYAPDIPEAPTGDIGPIVVKPAVPGIPSEARTAMPDSDFVEVYCLMTKWKSGAFFAALDSVETHLESAVRKSEDIVGSLGMPDAAAIRIEANRMIEEVCQATTVEAANAAVDGFAAYGESVRAQYQSLRNEMSYKLQAKGDALRAEIQTKIQPIADAEKAAAEAELNALGESLGAAAQSDLENEVAGKTFTSAEEAQAYVNGRIGSLKSSIERQIQAKVDEYKRAIEAKVQVEVDKLVGPDRAVFEELGRELGSLGSKIDAGVAAGQAQYENYRTQAFAKRKALVLGFVDKSIVQAGTELEKNRAQLDAARTEDPSVKTVEDVMAEMRADRAGLESALDAALASENEVAFQAAVDGFRAKWEDIRAELEKATFSVSAICTKAVEQVAGARVRLDDGSRQIAELRGRCQATVSDECAKVNELAPRFETLTSKMGDIGERLSGVETVCQDQASTNEETLMGMLADIKAAGQELETYGLSLEAEKSRIMAESAAGICAQVLPQLAAAKLELQDNDLAGLEANVNRCKGKTTEECAAVNAVAGEVNSFRSEINAFLDDAAEMESSCGQAIDEERFLAVRDLAEYLRTRGDALKAMSKELRLKQSEKADMGAICGAVQPRLEIATKEISQGVSEASATLAGCSGKTDERCAVINAAAGQFNAITAKAESILRKINKAIDVCGDVAEGAIDAAFLAELEAIRADQAELEQLIAELKSESDQRWPVIIKSGKPFKVVFDASPSVFDDSAWTGDWRTDQMGTIRGGETYTLTYRPGSWAATGYNEGARQVGTWTYMYGDPDAYQIDIWGRVYKFDSDGRVYDPDYGFVGHLVE